MARRHQASGCLIAIIVSLLVISFIDTALERHGLGWRHVFAVAAAMAAIALTLVVINARRDQKLAAARAVEAANRRVREQDAATPWYAPAPPAPLRLQYRDRTGAVVERVCRPQTLTGRGMTIDRRVTHIDGYCERARAPRTFYVDRVEQAAEAETGREIPDLSAYLVRAVVRDAPLSGAAPPVARAAGGGTPGQDWGRPAPPAKLLIGYCDAEANVTERTIRPARLEGITGEPDGDVLIAFCELRGGLRNFRLDRIDWAANAATGEVIDDIAAYCRAAPAQAPPPPAADTPPPNAAAEAGQPGWGWRTLTNAVMAAAVVLCLAAVPWLLDSDRPAPAAPRAESSPPAPVAGPAPPTPIAAPYLTLPLPTRFDPVPTDATMALLGRARSLMQACGGWPRQRAMAFSEIVVAGARRLPEALVEPALQAYAAGHGEADREVAHGGGRCRRVPEDVRALAEQVESTRRLPGEKAP